MNSGLFRAVGPLALSLSVLPASAIEINLAEVGAARAAAETAFAPARFQNLKAGEPVSIRALPVGDRVVDLELEPFSIWTDDAMFVIDDTEHARPDITLLRGRVAGEDDSMVVVGIGEHTTNGFIQSGGKMFSVSTGPAGALTAAGTSERGDLLISDMAEMDLGTNIPTCAVDMDDLDTYAPVGQPVYPENAGAARGTPPCRVVKIAIDTDWLWCAERFGGNAEAGAEYAMLLMAGISEIYQREVNVRLVVPYLRVFSSNVDPYENTNDPDPLDQVRSHWTGSMQHIDRDLTHLFTGVDTVYGGVAYLSVVCNDQYGYGVSSYHNGSFPYPLVDNNNGNWDLVVTAHELGHNFGTGHTHDSYSPPIDPCGTLAGEPGGCQQQIESTIMSYCHVCPGGLTNTDLSFHPRVRERIGNFLDFDAPCDLTPDNDAGNDSAETFPGATVDIFVLANDSGPDCAAVGIQSVQSPTPGGGTAEIAGWDNVTGDPTGRFIRYTAGPEQSGSDSFTYTTTAGQTATVTIDLLEFREAVNVAHTLPGLEGAWYAIGGGNSVVPDFSGLTPSQTGVVANLNYPSTSGNAVGSSMSDNVGAVFEGYLDAPEAGLYNLTISSDDGSLLYLGDELVADNNGLHGMETAGASVALEAGLHPVRIEFFESGGDAGLIFGWTGPAGSGVVPASRLVYEDADPCLADLAVPFGVLDLNDINTFVIGFQLQDDTVDLAEPFGVLDLNDITAFVGSFNSGCP